HHPEPAALHRGHARKDRDLLYIQQRAVRRSNIRGAVDRGPDALDDRLVLDPQTEGAVPVRRLRRITGSSRQGEAVPWSLSRPDRSTRLFLLYRANSVGALWDR